MSPAVAMAKKGRKRRPPTRAWEKDPSLYTDQEKDSPLSLKQKAVGPRYRRHLADMGDHVTTPLENAERGERIEAALQEIKRLTTGTQTFPFKGEGAWTFATMSVKDQARVILLWHYRRLAQAHRHADNPLDPVVLRRLLEVAHLRDDKSLRRLQARFPRLA